MAKRSQATRQAKQKNDRYWRQVRSAISGFSRASINSMAAATYQAAVVATWQDSGRAAYHWAMAVGSGPGSEEFNWAVIGVPPVGKKGEKRSEDGGEEDVISNRMEKYGIREGAYPAVSRWVSEHVGDPKERKAYGVYQGAAPAKASAVTIYNPLEGVGPYSESAFVRHGSVYAAMSKAQTEQYDILHRELNRGKKSPEELAAFVASHY